MAVTYLDPARIVAAHRGTAPRNPYASGYGRAIPTGLTLTLDDRSQTRRVYVACYANAGTAYVTIAGEWHVIGPEAEERIAALTAK